MVKTMLASYFLLLGGSVSALVMASAWESNTVISSACICVDDGVYEVFKNNKSPFK